MLKSGNPTLREERFEGLVADGGQMTLSGTVNKTAILLALVLITAGLSWNYSFQGGAYLTVAMMGSLIVSLVLAFITSFRPAVSPYTAPLYALAEGVVVGTVSAYYDARFGGIVIQAVGLTFGTMIAMLLAWRSGIIQVTDKFRLGVVAATGAIALLYLVSMVLRLFGMPIGFIHEGGLIGIGFSLVVVGIASLNLVLDFDFVKSASEQGAPRYMEWYGAFGLITTLVWLYLELLRLLSKLQKR